MTAGWEVEASSTGRIVVAPNLPEHFALFYTTADFDGALDDESIALLRETLLDRFGIEASLASCGQVHGVEVVDAGASSKWCEYSGCDALYTANGGMALGIKVADCLPVTLIDPLQSVMANIHSGWRGTAARIVPATVSRLRTETAFDPSSASAWLGPSIRSCCFEVGDEVAAQFVSEFDDAERFIDRSRGERPYLDLAKLTSSLLSGLGFDRNRIHDSGLCTRCEGSIFHSYRRNGPRAGRNLAIVAR